MFYILSIVTNNKSHEDYQIYTKKELQNTLKSLLNKESNVDIYQAVKELNNKFELKAEIKKCDYQTFYILHHYDEYEYIIFEENDIIDMMNTEFKEEKRNYVKPQSFTNYLYEAYLDDYRFLKVTSENNHVKIYRAEFDTADDVEWLLFDKVKIDWDL